MKHRHHIIPRHMGGSDEPSNIIVLSVEEHAKAHKELYERYGRWQDKVAWHGLAGIIGHEEAVSIACRPMLGRKHTPETYAKMSQPKSKEHAAKVGLTKRGKPRSEEVHEKIRVTWKLKTSFTPMSEEL